MKAFRIEKPTIEDVDTLYKWGEENWELWGDDKYKWFSKKSLLRWITEPEDDVLLVAKEGDALVGMCITNVIRDWGFCFGLFVVETFRGKEIGKRLLSETERELKKKGVTSFSLLVDVKNTKALEFYKREGLYRGYQFYLMTKELKEGA